MKTILIATALLLAACGPAYRTNYVLNEPATESGRLCSANVIEMSNACVQSCRQMAHQCETTNSAFATSIDLGKGGRWGRSLGYDIGGRTGSADCSSSKCEASCLAAARQSHTNCGGTVTEQTVCTRNCPPAQ